MIRWVLAIFVLLAIFYPLLPFLGRVGVGRVPLDVRFRYREFVFCLPFGSALVWSAIAFLMAKLTQWF
jgi:hypothetical protein